VFLFLSKLTKALSTLARLVAPPLLQPAFSTAWIAIFNGTSIANSMVENFCPYARFEVLMHQTIPEQLRGLIFSETGLRRPSHGSERVDQAIHARMKLWGLSSPDLYSKLLEAGDATSRAEIQELRIALTNGETHFFRDSGQFALLEKILLPALIRAKTASQTLRIWSAGCATGEEAHSIAIILQSLVQKRPDLNVEILGTDINEEALRNARAGVYSSWSFRGVSKERKAAHFQQDADQWKLKSQACDRVQFRRVDLIHDAFPSLGSGIYDIDLILCRNVFIYFEPKAIRRVVEKMTGALRPGGYLLTAHGELHGQKLDGLQVLSFPESCVYQKRPNLFPSGWRRRPAKRPPRLHL
jgi:chemotaxis protein methyltransferase CheR